jgi:hypothetical protein
LVIADAAFQLGLETSEPRWLTLGKNLLALTLDKFRPRRQVDGDPRGIAEFPVREIKQVLGLELWPDAQLYTLHSNARAYLLLKRLSLVLERFQDAQWTSSMAQALREQESFLRRRILPEVEQTGVVPAGLFEVQDVEQKSSALAAARWTGAEDWLDFLEAALEMEIPEETCREWLDNLARVHGVWVDSRWGLDWRVALLRPDALSPELTARFLRMARSMQHARAEAFAAKNLEMLRRKDLFPTVLTTAPRTHALVASTDYTIRPWANLLAWPPALSLFRHLRELDHPGWDISKAAPRLSTVVVAEWKETRTDLTVAIFIVAGIYTAVLGSALFWWGFRALRRRKRPQPEVEAIVSEIVMQRAEERWAKRVLGSSAPPSGEHWRYCNAPVEQNFLTQLRVIYKLLLEWRRLENNWSENDPRLVDDAGDSWLNGGDEFAVLIGLYMRSVIKRGAKDGFARADVLTENEDSNHIWARLTLYFSEHLWSLGTAVRGWIKARGGPEQDDYRAEILQTLEAMGLHQRLTAFDARELFNFPANPRAFDLLVVQEPAKTLTDIMSVAAFKLDVPFEQIQQVIRCYKAFKQREQPYPIHPYLVEFAKEVPHFALMGLGAIVWYNQRIGDQPIIDSLKSLVRDMASSWESMLWAVPLFGSLVLAVLAHFLRVYRFKAAITREKADFVLDATVTSFFVKKHEAAPKARTGGGRDPDFYRLCGWVLRALGYGLLATTLFRLDTPSFGTFLIIKGILAMLALAEVAAVILPLASTALSMWVQDGCERQSWLRGMNKLNLTATTPASPLWLSIKYLAQPSMPTGSNGGLVQAVIFYFVLAASFFFGAGYLCQEIFPLWFTDMYLQAANGKLILGGLVFGVTMVLLRYGLFLLFTGVASVAAAFPALFLVGLVATTQILLAAFGVNLGVLQTLFWGMVGLVIVIASFQKLIPVRSGARRSATLSPSEGKRDGVRRLPSVVPRLGIVYMSGDDLSFLKLTPDLLMTRWGILRDRLDSQTIQLLAEMGGKPDDTTVRSWFQQLYDAEKQAAVTLWHPIQLSEGTPSTPRLSPELGLTISLPAGVTRQQLLLAWHIRRWLVCMMSTAGHSQDTAVNLVDIALRLENEGLSQDTVFYLMQNKYDNAANNRPSQTDYNQGELAHRNKLARLLCAVAPGARAWCVQDWTPFGFKAGGLAGMDLVYDETLRLTTLLLLDRNATVHDLDALMLDLREAVRDPNLVIVVPGRGTTNTLTPIGQSSQLVEEGHRSFLRGLMTFLGGTASEAVGTGWGNILACYYGRVQRALLSTQGRKMPLTSRMKRGTSFADRTEGLIGFGPHAVGISEDIWAVVQGMNTALGLGYRPRFSVSRAIWHKIRETWSHAEWLASFPRWAGGYFQMLHDPLMQRIYDFGPQPVFAREIRSHSGRHFLSAPLALLNILLMPLAIIFDVSPFVQTLVILWNCGFILNQILTVHALDMYLESSGFYRAPALIGAGVMAAVSWLTPASRPFAPGLVLAGFLTGGLFVGISRWLSTRLRDLLLFGPQLVLQTLSQTVRLSLEFIVSGTSAEDAKNVNVAFRAWVGPREDRPLEVFPNFLNLRTVIWIIGVISTILCLFALTNLDMLNVLLLLPSLLFSISMIAGPFLMSPSPGKDMGGWKILPRAAGWFAAALFYVVVSICIAQPKALRWVGTVLLLAVFGYILSRGLKYSMFRRRIEALRNRLKDLLQMGGSQEPDLSRLANQVIQICAADVTKLGGELQKAGLAAEQQGKLLQFAQERIAPVLRQPVLDLQKGLLSVRRWANEGARAFVLGVFILMWFFLVPVPGLIVFIAGSYPASYRFTLGLGNVLMALGCALIGVLLANWLGKLIQWFHWHGAGKSSLKQRYAACWAKMKESSGHLTEAELAHAFALLTDSQTYFDQRGYAYARHALDSADRILERPRSS